MFFSEGHVLEVAMLSSTEAEHTGIIECVKTVIQFRGVLEELHLPQLMPTIIYNDNKSAITLANDYTGNFNRVRYFLPRVNWLTDQVRDGVCVLHHMPGEILPPDMETKPLSPGDFEKKRGLRMGV